MGDEGQTGGQADRQTIVIATEGGPRMGDRCARASRHFGKDPGAISTGAVSPPREAHELLLALLSLGVVSCVGPLAPLFNSCEHDQIVFPSARIEDERFLENALNIPPTPCVAPQWWSPFLGASAAGARGHFHAHPRGRRRSDVASASADLCVW